MLLAESDPSPSYRAPAEDGGLVSTPRWSALPRLLSPAHSRAAGPNSVGGKSWHEFQVDARSETRAAALDYAATYLDLPPAIRSVAADAPWIVAGHQPELIHPGVWFKNFAASDLAARVGGLALNLVIDSDAAHNPAIRVPAGTADEPRFEVVPFDAAGPPVAWEERRIRDAALWQSFGERATAAMQRWHVEPLVASWWPAVLQHAGKTPGLAFAKARHALELEWGQRTLEIPQSLVCQTRSFRRFVLHLLNHAREFRDAYNAALADFRRRHHIRNHAHPAPNLAASDDWCETPLWTWSADEPTRRAVFVRAIDGELEISGRRGRTLRLPNTASGSEGAVDAIAAWEASGVRLRSRALTTTLFARLALADLFIHGIGGARYDEATDAIARSFFGVELAPYAAISGTLRLPLNRKGGGGDSANAISRRLRDLVYHPEKFVAGAPLAAADAALAEKLVGEKRRWVATAKTPTSAAVRHQGIAAANAQLRDLLAEVDRTMHEQLAAARRQDRAAPVLDSREYAFCLFPPAKLREFLLDFSSRLA